MNQQSNISIFDDRDASLYFQIEEYNISQKRLKEYIQQKQNESLNLFLISKAYINIWKKQCLLDKYDFDYIKANKQEWFNERRKSNKDNTLNQLDNGDICIMNSRVFSVVPESDFHLVSEEFFKKLKNNGNLFKLKYEFKSINNQLIARANENTILILLLIHENKFKLFLLQLDNINSDTIYNYIENNNMNIIFIQNDCFNRKKGCIKIKDFNINYLNKSYESKMIDKISELSKSTGRILCKAEENLNSNVIYQNPHQISVIQNQNNITNIVINNIILQKNISYVEYQKKSNMRNLGIINMKQYKPVGLKNTDNCSIINSLLQCLSHCQELTFYLDINYKVFTKNIDKFPLINAYIDIIKHLFPPNNNYKSIYDSSFFKKKLNFQSNYLSDLINNILEKMDKELNYNKSNQTIISNNFVGKKKINNLCSQCGYNPFNIEYYRYIFFPLEEAKKYIIEQQPYDLSENIRKFINEILDKSNIGKINLDFCLNNYQSNTVNIYCEKCKINSKIIIFPQFIYNPNIICLILNNNLNSTSYEVKVDFSENRIFREERDNTKIYELFGVISHLEKENNSRNEHFIAFCKSIIDNKWYWFNDEKVYNCSFNDILYNGTPYALFYHIKKNCNN